MTENIKGVLLAACISACTAGITGWVATTATLAVIESRVNTLEKTQEATESDEAYVTSIDKRVSQMESSITPGRELIAELTSLRDAKESHNRRIVAAWNKINKVDERVGDLRVVSERSTMATQDLVKAVDSLTNNVARFVEITIRLEEKVKLLEGGNPQ